MQSKLVCCLGHACTGLMILSFLQLPPMSSLLGVGGQPGNDGFFDCSLIFRSLLTALPWLVNGILSWESLCSSTCCIHHPVILPVFFHFLSPNFFQQLYFSSLPLELPSDPTSRLVMEIACKVILECHKHY